MTEATKLVTEPPHAPRWEKIREKCEGTLDWECGYPFCTCVPSQPRTEGTPDERIERAT